MTEQEAEAVAKRLERVWGPLEMVESGVDDGEFFYLAYLLDGTVELEVTGHGVPLSRVCTMRTYNNGQYKARLTNEWGQIGGASFVYGPEHEAQNQFVSEFLGLFRRGCWLSGCDIEASGHEKAEWMQDFSPEEIEAWNLKM